MHQIRLEQLECLNDIRNYARPLNIIVDHGDTPMNQIGHNNWACFNQTWYAYGPYISAG